MRELPTSTRLWCGTHHHRQYRWASSTRQKTRMGRQQDCSSHCATDISVKTVAPTNARSGGVSARSICAKSVASECHRGLLIGWAPFAVAISCRLRNTHAIIDGEGLSSQKARTNGRKHPSVPAEPMLESITDALDVGKRRSSQPISGSMIVTIKSAISWLREVGVVNVRRNG